MMRPTLLSVLCLVACSRDDDKLNSTVAKGQAEHHATPTAPATGGAASTPAVEAAIARAKSEHKPLVLEFYTAWCKPCQVFEHTTLADARVKAAMSRIVFVRYDAEAEPGTAAAERYRVTGFPTFVAVDKEGVARKTQDGLEGDGVQQFLSFIDAAEAETMTEADVRARLAAKPTDNAVRMQAARWFAGRGKHQDALVQLDAVAADHTANDAQRAEARITAMRLRRVAKWTADLIAEKLAVVQATPAAVAEEDLAIATVDSGLPPAQVRDVIGKVLAANSNPNAINGLLYVALAAGAKDEALAAAKRVLASSKEPNLLDTLAECYYVHGDKQDALRVEDRAIALAGKDVSSGLTANRARFAKGIGDSDEVTRLHAGARDLAKRLAHIEQASADSEPPSGADMKASAMASFTARRKLAAQVGTACASVAGKSEGAFARVALDSGGKVTSSKIFTDDTATPALRTCIAKQLAGATLPVAPGMEDMPIDIELKAHDVVSHSH